MRPVQFHTGLGDTDITLTLSSQDSWSWRVAFTRLGCVQTNLSSGCFYSLSCREIYTRVLAFRQPLDYPIIHFSRTELAVVWNRSPLCFDRCGGFGLYFPVSELPFEIATTADVQKLSITITGGGMSDYGILLAH